MVATPLQLPAVGGVVYPSIQIGTMFGTPANDCQQLMAWRWTAFVIVLICIWLPIGVASVIIIAAAISIMVQSDTAVFGAGIKNCECDK